MDAPARRHHAQREQGGLAAAGERALATVLFRLGPRQKDAGQGHDLHHAGRQHPLWVTPSAANDARGRPARDFSAAPARGRRFPRRRRRARLAPAREFARCRVADPIAEAGIARLREHAEVDVQLKQSPASLVALIPEYDALIVRSETRVDANVIQAGTRLKVIGRAGAGVDNIDVEAATRAGVLVVNAPSGNTIAATEHTMAMMLALARHRPQADQAVKAGHWERSRILGFELRDKVLGVVGLGSIGREVAHRAQAFGMRVIATDPVLSEERASQLNVKLVPFNQLMSEADLITLHVPLTRETHHLVDARALALAKPGMRLINVARGGIVDESALRDALRDGQVAGAAIDVFEQEIGRA